MFKASRWRGEKNKIKASFTLQFHATQVPSTEWEFLMVSMVPGDAGKPTARSEKAAVVGGVCHWNSPVRETVKLVRDTKNGRINEKVYRFLVSSAGSEKCELLGEASVNLADYVEGIKPSTVSLPLDHPDYGIILHVTVQKMHAYVNGREGNENGDRNVREQARKIISRLKTRDEEVTVQKMHAYVNGREGDENGDRNVRKQTRKIISRLKTQDEEDGLIVNSQAQLKLQASKSRYLQANSNENLQKCNGTHNISSGSDSSSEQYIPGENGIDNSEGNKNLGSSLLPLSKKGIPQKEIRGLIDLVTDYRDQQKQRLITEWSVNSHDTSTKRWEETLEDSSVYPGKYGRDDVGLSRQIEAWEVEVQTLEKQVEMERRLGQDMSVELSRIKEERDALIRELEELKAQQRIGDENISKWQQLDTKNPRCLHEEIKQELNHEKNSNAYLRLQLEKTQESNSELILAVQDLEELLEQKNREITCTNWSTVSIVPGTADSFPRVESQNKLSNSHSYDFKQESFGASSEDDEQHALDVLVKEHNGVKRQYSLEQKIADLNNEIELYKKDIEEQEMHMEQLALDYEILKQENHSMSSKLEQSQLREQLKMQYECSAHVSIITDLEAQIRDLEKELDERAEAFEADIETITHAKVEQEQRAIRAEEALRKTRLHNAHTADKLKQEFEMLSEQISSTFDMNERLATQALTEATELCVQKCHLEEQLAKANEELSQVQGKCHVKIQELLSVAGLKTKEADKLLMELKDKSEELENQKKSEYARKKTFLEDMIVLKDQIQSLSRERGQLLERIEQKETLLAEMDQLKASVQKNDTLLQESNMEREKVDRELMSIRGEAEKSMKKLHGVKQVMDDKETVIRTLNSEVAILRAQYNELKHSLFEDELEKENLRKQVFQLRKDLQKKGEMLTSSEKRLKDNNAILTSSDGTIKATLRNKNTKSIPAPHVSKDVSSLNEKIKLLEAKIKMKDAELEDAKSSFLEKEKDLSNRIEELETSINRSKQEFCVGELHEETINVVKNIGIANSNKKTSSQQEIEDREGAYSPSDPSDMDRELSMRSTKGPDSANEEESLASDKCDLMNMNVLLKEMEVLKEKNYLMEAELKEMQERYSEVSLKFAEVEGERQQLVMTVRTLKSALKS